MCCLSLCCFVVVVVGPFLCVLVLVGLVRLDIFFSSECYGILVLINVFVLLCLLSLAYHFHTFARWLGTIGSMLYVESIETIAYRFCEAPGQH